MSRVMIDLETLGTSPGCAILSIGATRFTLDGPTGTPFHAAIDPETCEDHGLTIDASTVQWWMKQPDDARTVFQNGAPLYDGLEAFYRWCQGADEVWANAPTFDCAILRAAYDAINEEPPWKYYDERCHRTLKNLPLAPSLKREGTHHNAKDDAVHQAKVAAATLAAIHNPPKAPKPAPEGGTP